MEEETIDLPADNIEDKKEKIRKLVEEGYTNREIADQTGIPFGTVGYHAARFRKKEKEPVDNSDRHLCKTCKFRSNRPTVNSCDYAGLMNHSRGCKVEECTKYEKGARMKMKDVEEGGIRRIQMHFILKSNARCFFAKILRRTVTWTERC